LVERFKTTCTERIERYKERKENLLSACSILEIKRLFLIMIPYAAKNYQVAVKQTCIFFLLPTASSFLITSLSGWGGGDAHGQGEGDAQGGKGDARASCASPLGTPL
jgi:hypothetical protein